MEKTILRVPEISAPSSSRTRRSSKSSSTSWRNAAVGEGWNENRWVIESGEDVYVSLGDLRSFLASKQDGQQRRLQLIGAMLQLKSAETCTSGSIKEGETSFERQEQEYCQY